MGRNRRKGGTGAVEAKTYDIFGNVTGETVPEPAPATPAATPTPVRQQIATLRDGRSVYNASDAIGRDVGGGFTVRSFDKNLGGGQRLALSNGTDYIDIYIWRPVARNSQIRHELTINGKTRNFKDAANSRNGLYYAVDKIADELSRKYGIDARRFPRAIKITNPNNPNERLNGVIYDSDLQGDN